MLVETQEEPMLVAAVSYTWLIGVILQADLILIGKVVELLEVVSYSDYSDIPCYLSLLTSYFTGPGGRAYARRKGAWARSLMPF
jgi:hypothetical protein